MDPVDFLQDQWETISSAPAVYVGTAILVWIIAAKFTRSRLGDENAALRERNDHLRDRIVELQRRETELLEKLEGHGEDIAAIKADLATRPRVHLGAAEPQDAKEGDIWLN